MILIYFLDFQQYVKLRDYRSWEKAETYLQYRKCKYAFDDFVHFHAFYLPKCLTIKMIQYIETESRNSMSSEVLDFFIDENNKSPYHLF